MPKGGRTVGTKNPPPDLMAMRRVVRDPEERCGDSPLVLRLKQQFAEDFDKFMARKDRLEAAWRGQAKRAGVDAEADGEEKPAPAEPAVPEPPPEPKGPVGTIEEWIESLLKVGRKGAG